jgi:hypothetical protein
VVSLLNTPTVLVCLKPQTTITTIYLGAAVSTSTFGVVTSAVMNGSLISAPLATSPTVIAFSPAATVLGDPQFIGLLGQSFQVHGIDGAVYNIITEPTMQLNSRFRFLQGPRACPIMPVNKKSSACWSHPGSYLAELGLQIEATAEKVFIGSGSAAQGFAAVNVNGIAMKVGSSTPSESVTLLSTHELTFRAGSFIIEVENVDGFVNLRSVSTTVPAGGLTSHGLLGQTHRRPSVKSTGTLKAIEGEVDDYVIAEDDVMGVEFPFNQFNTKSE